MRSANMSIFALEPAGRSVQRETPRFEGLEVFVVAALQNCFKYVPHGKTPNKLSLLPSQECIVPFAPEPAAGIGSHGTMDRQSVGLNPFGVGVMP